ncbi:MAG: ferredoxin domain-containing protein [Chloroflexota bacterium]
MARIDSKEAEFEAVLSAAQLMTAAARTSPKTRGLDSVKMTILTGEDLEPLAQAMEAKQGQKAHPLAFFGRDAKNVRGAAAVLLVGVTGEPKKPQDPINCGACGYRSCAEFLQRERQQGEDFSGPNCVFQAIDLGIAVGVAVKLASELGIDNRIMYTIGAAARTAGIIDADVVLGVPLTVSGKNPFFDRP